MNETMAHSRKGGRQKPATVVDPALGRWGALFTFRGNPLFQITHYGPRVKASTPEELKENTAIAMEREGTDDVN